MITTALFRILLAASALLVGCAPTPPTPSQPPQRAHKVVVAPKQPPREMPTFPPISEECKALGKASLLGRPPVSPPAAKNEKQDGWVVLQFDVDSENTTNIKVLDSSPPITFDDAAIKHIQVRSFPGSRNAKSCRLVVRFMNEVR